ncbi:calcium-translocating P-type ATPase, PMCA-type [Christensenella sp. MSJ-20]|uniref:calcium-translocating P-type ATPase, PMCA-type n=1 Tax=Christensenella sp. MSJ-20 TaxID=2841518 RepID=UPI001C757AAC|nr:calcium-translocating P-type ATPase, PMCA-type [Christensenella sp. MSJ-20]
MEQNFYSQSVEQTAQALGTDQNRGLGGDQAREQQQKHGFNELEQKPGKTTFQLFVDQLKDFMIIVLLAAAVISGALGEVVDACVILLIVVLNAIIGVAQQKKAEQSLNALKKMSAPFAKVLREGEVISIPAREVVVGDVVILEAGDMVPADMRLVECVNLKIQESALTGESDAVEKDASVLLPEGAPLGDRINMAYSSSVVTYGRGRGVVTAIAMDTEVGRIAHMLQQEGDRMTPLQQKLEKLGKTLAIAALAICVVIFAAGMLYNKPFFEMFLTSVSLAVAAIPEGLPAIATIVLALSVQRMAKLNAIVRTLPSVETLGSATVICSDKTGTLTMNQMEVLKLYVNGETYAPEEARSGELEALLLNNCALCNDARFSSKDGGETALGDPTEIALINVAKRMGYNKSDLEEQSPRVAELPFDSDRKLMTTVHRLPDGTIRAFVKGAVDILLNRCTRIGEEGGSRPITEEDRAAIAAANDGMAQSALRVLAMAYQDIDAIPEKDEMPSLEENLIYIGMVGMMDPPRPEARDAVALCAQAGIRPVMITGDHKTTAVAIAESLGILREGDLAITGQELEAMSDAELAEKVDRISVYARISPEHKVRIVNAWQKNGHIVAMTGDGVNDAPALKNADIGAAMGIVGTEVAKEAADIVLTDDNFATVVSAVGEGRRIYDNILKAIQFLLSCNVGEIFTLFLATLLNWHEPLLPVHILWVNLVTDSLPALGLGVDPAEKGIMNRKAERHDSVFTKGLVWRMCYQGLLIGGITLLAYTYGFFTTGVEAGRTMAFVTLAFSQLIHVFNVRSSHLSAFSRDIGRNKYLWGAVGISAALMLLVLFVPFLSGVFSVVALTAMQWLVVLGLCLVPVVVVEIFKLLKCNEINGQ